MSENNENIILDESFDIGSLITFSEEEAAEKELTPAQKLIEAKKQLGMVVDKKELEDGENKPLKNPVDNDMRLERYDQEVEGYTDRIDVRVYLHQKKSITNDIEHMQLMEELNVFNLDSLKELQKKYPNGVPLKSEFFDLASVEETERNREKLKANQKRLEESKKEPQKEEEIGTVASPVVTDDTPNAADPVEVVEETAEEASQREEKESLVKVLIDKTGFGMPVEFDEVERDKILNASQIDLIEVESMNLDTMTVVRPGKSFIETIGEYDYSGIQIPMAFPCSRFRGTMSGLSYGEMADIALSYDNSTYETERKKLSIVYNKMKNITCGAFETFDDFLDGFAYPDLDLAIYGLYIASCPEADSITLRCGKESCGRSFNAPFRSRSLLNLKSASPVFLRIMEKLMNANGTKAEELRKESPVINYKMIKLPRTGWIVKIGMMSCRDYLEGIVRNGDVEEFVKTHQDDVNGVKYRNIIFFQTVRSIYIPNGSGSYTEFDSYDDILNALYVMNPDDFQLLGSMLDKYVTDYNVRFVIENVTCPHCKTHTEEVDVNITEMVFRAYQRRINTTVNLGKLQDL